MENKPIPGPPGLKASTRELVIQSLVVLLGNCVPLYGVLALGWNSFALVMLFVLEGVIVLVTDYVRRFFIKPTKKKKGILFFETVFILFFGFFALMVFAPSGSDSLSFNQRTALVKTIFTAQVMTPLLVIAVFRLFRLCQDLFAAGFLGGLFRRPLEYAGGGWMLLLFFAVMLAPFIAKSGPNATGGLAALVGVKTAGELLGVWAMRIANAIPDQPRKPNN